MSAGGWGQTFSRDFPCPICGGDKHRPQHIGERCWGRLTADGERAICTREDFAGPLVNRSGNGYLHFLKGSCRCGQSHDGQGPALAMQPGRTLGTRLAPKPQAGEGRIGSLLAEYGSAAGLAVPERKVGEKWYAVRDVSGEIQAYHRREDFEQGEGERRKEFRWYGPDRRAGLAGRPRSDLPLYGSEILIDAHLAPPETAFVVICEGEKACDSLNERSIPALATVTGASDVPSRKVLAGLAGLHVFIWPDADEIGASHGARLANALQGIARTVRIVDWQFAPEAGDAYDFWRDGNDQSDLEDLLRAAVIYTPSSEAEVLVPEHSRQEQEQVREESWRLLSCELIVELERVGFGWAAKQMSECREFFRPRICKDCQYRPAIPMSCKEQICPRCFPGRFKADWRKQSEEKLKGLRFRLYRLRANNPLDEDEPLKQIIARFREWRDRHKLSGGFVGYRYETGSSACILLALSEAQSLPEDLAQTAAFSVELLTSAPVSAASVGDWLQEEYVAEVRQALTDGVVQSLVRWIKARRRFQGFGDCYRHPDLEAIEDSPLTGGVGDERVVLGRISGGSLSKVGKMICPNCGGSSWLRDLTRYPIDRAIKVDKGWIWTDTSLRTPRSPAMRLELARQR